MKQKGAQDPAYIILRSGEIMNRSSTAFPISNDILRAPNWKTLTSLQGMTKRGIVMSCAHSDATYDEFEKAWKTAYTYHAYLQWKFVDQQSLLLLSDRRVRGGVAFGQRGSGGDCRRKASARSFFAPGSHQIKGADHMNICTDVTCAADMPPGEYRLGGASGGR